MRSDELRRELNRWGEGRSLQYVNPQGLIHATHVAIQHSSKKGKIEIEYYGDDDLQRLIELLGLPNGD